MSSQHLFPVGQLETFASRCFQACGMVPEEAALVAANLVLADLRGVASHGVTRIPIYADRLQRGVVNARARPVAVADAGALLLVDGDNGAGAVVSHFANGLAMQRAREFGSCIVSVRRSNHHGICSAYAMQAAERGLIGVVATNASRSMAVAGGREAVIGTNPVAFAVPRTGQPPLVLDMATAVVARGRIVEMAKRGESIPEGWALDAGGNPTTDARAAERGVVLPFGGAKGSGLAVVVELLCSVLSGATLGPHIPNLYADFERPQDIGHLFIVIDPQRIGRDDVALQAQTLAGLLKSSAPAVGAAEVLMPGEPEARLQAQRRAAGVPLPENVVQELQDWAQRLGVPALVEGLTHTQGPAA